MVFYPKFVKKNQQILLGNTLSRVWLSSLLCTGRENSLLDCPKTAFFGWRRYCYLDAEVVCEKPKGRFRYLLRKGFLTILLMQIFCSFVLFYRCSSFYPSIQSIHSCTFVALASSTGMQLTFTVIKCELYPVFSPYFSFVSDKN